MRTQLKWSVGAIVPDAARQCRGNAEVISRRLEQDFEASP
jgi:hypothetical protein